MKSFLSSIPAFLLFAFTPVLAFAVEKPLIDCAANPELSTCQASNLDVSTSLATIIQFLFVVAVILALGFLIYGGIRWITSGGDKAGVETARNTIIAAIIGLIVVFLAYVIINLVLTFLTGRPLSDLEIPNLQGCIIDKTGGIPTGCHTPENATYSCSWSDATKVCTKG